jgi:hypothetical protein
MSNLEIFAELRQFRRSVSLYIAQPAHPDSQTQHIAMPLVFSPVGLGDITEPTVELSMAASQSLMDELWRCGLRPSEGSGSAGSLAATERHLADMRRLVFGPPVVVNRESTQ